MRQAQMRDRLARWSILAMVFLAMTALMFIGLRTDEALTGEIQRTVYALGAGALLSGLVALLMAIQFSDEDTRRGWWFYPSMAGLLALVVMCLAYTYLGMWPLGERSAMIVDMHHQYAPLLAQLRSMLLEGDSFLYTFEVGLGASFLPLFGYYLASPFNLLLLLFPPALLTEGILVITLLKNALCAFFFALCVQYIYRRRDLSVPAVSLMYSMMMYLIAYSWNIMWLDCVMVLPLVVLGFERLMRTGKYLTYILPLAYALYCNYYIAFMLCVFLVLYFVVYLARQPRTRQQRTRSFGRFAVGSLFAGGLVMFLLVPVYLALGDTSAAGGTLPAMASDFNMFDLLGRHLYGGSPTIRSGNLPNIYCGVLTVVLLPIFATLRHIPLRRRLCYLGLVVFLAASMVINQLNLLWHGLHAPNDLPYRFSFIYSFVLLLIAFETLSKMRHIRPVQLGGTLTALIAYLMIEERFGEVYGFEAIYISLGLVLIYIVVLALAARGRVDRKPACALLLLVVTAEMLFHGGSSFVALHGSEYFTAHNSYVDNDATAAQRQAVERAEELGDAQNGGAFYRLEFLPRRTIVDTALYDYRGLTVFASSNSEKVTKFVGSLGYPNNGVNSHLYKTFQPVTDSLFGIEYVILSGDNSTDPYLEKQETVVYTNEETGATVTNTIYKNTAALPVGYVVDPAIKNWEFTKYNPIASQESLYASLTGDDRSLYAQAALAVESGPGRLSSEKGTAFTVNPADGGQQAVFTATVSVAGQGYLYVDCGAAKSIAVDSKGYNGSSSTTEPYMIDLGRMEAGDTAQVTITAENACSGNIYLVTLNDTVFADKLAALSRSPLNVTAFSQTRFEGTVDAVQAGTLFTSIIYDEGWTVTVDGQQVETFAAADAMLAFDVEPGSHTVVFSFRTKGLVTGLVLSVSSLILLVLWQWFLRRKVRDSGQSEFALLSLMLNSPQPKQPAAQPLSELAGGPPIPLQGERADDHDPDARL